MSALSDPLVTNPFHIRPARPGDDAVVYDIWWRSVRATHTFVGEDDLQLLRRQVRELHLERLDTWLLCDARAVAIGFLVLEGCQVEALFLVPEQLRRGGGRLLIEHARSRAGPLRVDVNEQNTQALRFYLAQNFRIVARSETDGAGLPYPLLHLAEAALRS